MTTLKRLDTNPPWLERSRSLLPLGEPESPKLCRTARVPPYVQQNPACMSMKWVLEVGAVALAASKCAVGAGKHPSSSERLGLLHSARGH